jgi:hypothetical protein
MKTTILPLKNSLNRSPLQCGFIFVVLVLSGLALSPAARAVCQEGCDTNSDTFLGDDALISDTTGHDNTAIGVNALLSNTSGSDNTAIGAFALKSNTFGDHNMAVGVNALLLNTNGSNNIAIGSGALLRNTSGSNNIALGGGAGFNLTGGNNNIEIGYNVIGVADDARTIRIGNEGTQIRTFIAGISRAIVPTGVPVIVDGSGHLGTTTSSARFKDEIKPMDKASEAILALKPVTFRYKHEFDPEGIPQFGLVAEDVEKVYPDLVARDEQGKPYTVRYEAVNAMLLNEFLKEHRKVESLEKVMAKQQTENAAMRAMLKEQASQIQKVSAQLELSKSAPQTVLNDQ